MTTSYGPGLLWLAIALIGILTYAIRGSFIALFGRLSEIPAPVETLLRYVPAAVLAGLVFPAFLTVGAGGDLAVDKLVAGAAAAGIAWRTENVLLTLLVGMGTLWALRFLVV